MKDHIEHLRAQSLLLGATQPESYGSAGTVTGRSSQRARREMEQFLEEKGCIPGDLLSSMEGLRKEIGSLERCREALATTTTHAGVESVVAAFEDARSYTTRQLHEFKAQIQRESDATEELARIHCQENSIDLRARRSGCLMLMHELRKLMGLLYGEVEGFRHDLREHRKNQLAIALPHASDKEIEDALDRGVGLQQVLNKRSSAGRVEKLQDLQDQRSDIMKLERSVAEVQEMMSTLALLIDRQGGLLDNIEFDVVNAKYTADKTYRTLVDTRRNQRRAQLWMLGCGFCCFIIIAIIVLLLVLLFGRRL
ncbi:Syntaxin-1A [Perkinsus olseni]|uniref:Syntaxin-1A n=1 Tax=Perkinsus olseni TaxID=32597 RepID=A0A7J6P0M8_PEROL|nr:Syntaxin-1A [Perkinsus olseni]